jgi:sugar/nucleoside kinase (ribokinase family)
MMPPVPLDARDVDVVTLGENSLDFVAVCANEPALAGKRRLTRFDLQPGGQTATAAVACVRLGLKARYVGAFGRDEWGARARSALRQEGVDIVAIEYPDCPSRIAVILVDEAGERSVLEYRGAPLAIDPIPDGVIETARVLIVDATDPVASGLAAARARRAGIPTLVDVDRDVPGLEALWRGIDAIIAPAPFVLAITGATAVGAGLRALATRVPTAAVVVATLGEEGALALTGDGREIRSPGFRVAVTDTTGAGDAFRGGFAAALVRLGSSAPLEDILTFANATAALNCRALGAQTALPTWDEVQALVTRGRDPRSN